MPDVTAEGVSAAMAIVATVISVIAVWYSHRQSRAAEHNEVLKALQGEKEAIGYIAFQIAEGGVELPKDAKRRKEVITGLCLAPVFEGSDRSRVLVFAALRRICEHEAYQQEVEKAVRTIEERFNSKAFEHLDLKHGRARLADLMRSLGLKSSKELTSPIGDEHREAGIESTEASVRGAERQLER
jgi:hypothetical protein